MGAKSAIGFSWWSVIVKSTMFTAPLALQVKQIATVVDADALYWPARSTSSSSRLPGGTRRSLMLSAALMRTSLFWVSLLSSGLSFLTSRRCQIGLGVLIPERADHPLNDNAKRY